VGARIYVRKKMRDYAHSRDCLKERTRIEETAEKKKKEKETEGEGEGREGGEGGSTVKETRMRKGEKERAS